MSTITPLPAWRGNAMQVPVPNYLMDAWDEAGSFAIAFCDTYETVTQGYDAAHAAGRLPHQLDEAVDRDAIAAALAVVGIGQVHALRTVLKPLWGHYTIMGIVEVTHLSPQMVVTALFNANSACNVSKLIAAEQEMVAEGRVQTESRKAFGRKHGLSDSTICKLTEVHGVAWDVFKRQSSMHKAAVEAFFADGVTSPSAILAELAERDPHAPLPLRNTISSWRVRWERAQA